MVRSAIDPKHRNRRVKFEDDIEEKLESLEVINPFVIPKKERTDVKDDNDSNDNDLVMNNKDIEEAGGIASRTRSRTLMAFHVNAVDSTKTKSPGLITIFKLMPYLVLFFLHSAMSCSAATPRVGDMPDLGEADALKCQNALVTATENTWEQLRYIHALERMEDGNDPDPSSYYGYDKDLWSVNTVTNHCWQHKGKSRWVEVKVTFNDPNKSSDWVNMFSLAMQDPVPIIKYAQSKRLTGQGPFRLLLSYCIGDTPSDLARAYKAKVKPGTVKIKFGVQVPLGVKQAFALDQKNGNHLWREAIKKEISQLDEYKVFRALKRDTPIPTGYKQVPYHIVFDVKFDLRHKACLVANGNWTDATREDIYSGVVAMDTVRMGFFVGELNGLKCCAGDVGNAYLNSDTREKVYIIAGPEFGPELQGRILIIVKALYGLRTSAARFHEHLANTLQNLEFRQSRADHNLWIRERDDHYKYIASFVDDVLVWSQNPMAVMDALKQVYTMKGVGVPEYYLGGDVENLDENWNNQGLSLAFSGQTYIKNVIPRFEAMFHETFGRCKTPMSSDYHPETDATPLCGPVEAARFRSIIGSCNWLITLGRFDINYATMSLSRFNMAPREGHLKHAKKILGYVKFYEQGKIIFDTSCPNHSKYAMEDHDNWGKFYPDATKDIPHDIPSPKGKSVRLTVYVDADHAHDLVTRRSVTGIVVMANNTPVCWISKRQKTVESSTYGSELVAARIATELILELRYMLRMMGVPLDGPALMLGDNMSVVVNTTLPSSVLKKKHCAIGYHCVREAIAAGIMRFAHIPSTENIADIMTKPLANQQFHTLTKQVLFRRPKHVMVETQPAWEE